MRINKKKLKEALYIIGFTPKEALAWLDDCIKNDISYMCHSTIWENSRASKEDCFWRLNSYRIVFDNGVDGSIFNDIKIPEIATCSKEERVRLNNGSGRRIKYAAEFSWLITRVPSATKQIRRILKEISKVWLI